MSPNFTWSKAHCNNQKKKMNANNDQTHSRGMSLPNIALGIGLSLSSQISQEDELQLHYKHTLNYYPAYLQVGTLIKQREVSVEVLQTSQVPEQYFIQVSKGEETIEKIEIDKHKFCGVQRWNYIKRHSGWGNRTVQKKYIAILFIDRVYVFQQMNKDSVISEGRADFMVELEEILKTDLGIKNWWKCVTCHDSGGGSHRKCPINLHLTKSSLSLVDGKELQPSCLKRWDIGEVKDCEVVNESKFTIELKTGCSVKYISNCKSREISEMIKKAIRPSIPPRPRRNAFKTRSCRSVETTAEAEKNMDIKANTTLPPRINLANLFEGQNEKENRCSQSLNVKSNPFSQNFNSTSNPCNQTLDLTPSQNIGDSQSAQMKGEVVVPDCAIAADYLRRKKRPLVRQRSFCTSNYMEDNWRGSELLSHSHKSSSCNDLSDLIDLEIDSWDDISTDIKDKPQQQLKTIRRSTKQSTVRKKLDRLANRDQMNIRASCQVSGNFSCDKEALTKKISIWEFEPSNNKQTSDVVYTLLRILERRPPEKNTLGIPSWLYHTICFKLGQYPGISMGKTKDWRDLAEMIGFHYEDIQMIASFTYQTPIATPQDILLQCWQDKHNRLQGFYKPACEVKNLVHILEKLQRRDLVEEIRNSKRKPNQLQPSSNS